MLIIILIIFDNLDIQEEVNTKLEEMAQSGELAELISQYLEAQAVIGFNTNSSLAAAQNLANGSFARTYGKETYNDGKGAFYKIRTRINSDVPDGDNIIVLTNTQNLVAEKIIDYTTNKLNQFVTIEEFKNSSDLDDTNAFNLAVADGRPIYLLDKTYSVSDTIPINKNTKIYGKSMNNTIINSTHSGYVFECITDQASAPYDSKANIELDNFKVTCKNFIKINDNTLPESDWINQGSLLHIIFKNLFLQGTYGTASDTNKDSNVLPSIETLLDYGCAFNCNSIFDSAIIDCRIEYFGVGVYFKGCDINRIEHNRMDLNGCHIYNEGISTYGSQNLIFHNDLLHNYRYGGIRLQGSKFDTINDNYFETYTASACYIYGEGERSVSIINNRFDNPTQANIDIIRLNPSNTDIIKNNRVNPSVLDQHCYINVLNDHIGNFVNIQTYNTAIIKDNNGKLELRNNPFIKTDETNCLLISPYNLDIKNQSISGSRFVNPYFILDSTDNLYYFTDQTASGTSLICHFVNLKKNYAKYLKIRIKYKSNNESSFYCVVKGDNAEIFRNFVNVNNNNKISYADIDLTATATLYDDVRIELPVVSGVKQYSIELV